MSLKSLSLALLAGLAIAPAYAADRAVETINGTVTIPEAPQRIVVLNSALAGSVYVLGFDVLAVGRSARATTEEGYSSVWAEQARKSGSTVVDFTDNGYNMEEILGLEPDLIIGGGQGFPGHLTTQAYDQLSAIAPTVLVDRAINTWQGEIAYLSDVLDRKDEADAAVATYEARVAEVNAAITLPPQPTVFLLPLEVGAPPYFLPEGSATPQLFAEVGFEPDKLTERFPDFAAYGTGDSVEVGMERVSDVLTAPTMIVVPWDAEGTKVADLAGDPITGKLPAIVSGQAYDFPDYAYRFDYYGALATLDQIEQTFAK